jgi:integrase
LDDAACKTLRTHLASHDSEWAFPANWTGKYSKFDGWISYDWFRRNVWIPACKKVGIAVGPRITRHQHCSELLMAGVPSAIIIRRTGHRSTAMLDMVYGHVLVEAGATALSQLLPGRMKSDEALTGLVLVPGGLRGVVVDHLADLHQEHRQ